MGDKKVLEDIKKIKAIADTGLLYASNEYEKERYAALQEISLSLLQGVAELSFDEVRASFPPVNDYPTAKVDIRAVVISPSKKILFVKEKSDGRWSLPGGWGEIGYSPQETVIKECKEETGLEVVPKKLLAVFDKRKHDHPPQSEYVYKMVFYCEAISEELHAGFDILDVQYFAIDDLPELSTNRILESQVSLVYNKVLHGDDLAYFE